VERASRLSVGLEGSRQQRGLYLGQDLLREGLGDLEEIGLDAGLLETFLLSFRELLDVSTVRSGY
jgi:hypothetical protein